MYPLSQDNKTGLNSSNCVFFYLYILPSYHKPQGTIDFCLFRFCFVLLSPLFPSARAVEVNFEHMLQWAACILGNTKSFITTVLEYSTIGIIQETAFLTGFFNIEICILDLSIFFHDTAHFLLLLSTVLLYGCTTIDPFTYWRAFWWLLHFATLNKTSINIYLQGLV